MPSKDDIVRNRFAAYAGRRSFLARRFLGSGKDGVVHEVESNDFPAFLAVKTFHRAEQFRRERDVYVRLREERGWQIEGHNIPQLVGYDDELMTIEMTMVTAPFILDFADAWLDEAPEFSEEVWADWNRKVEEDFEQRAGEVRRLLEVLRLHGVILLDVHPGNIRFK